MLYPQTSSTAAEFIARIIWCAAVSLAAGLCASCSGAAPALAFSGATMGTSYSVTVADRPASMDPEALRAGVEEVLERIETSMSTWREDSELSRFNRLRSADWVPVSPALAEVVAVAQELSRATGGAFDVTVGPLVDLWGFGPRGGVAQVPGPAAIAEARARVGYARLHVRRDPPALRKTLPELEVDLSAIAKGYGVDAVASWLQAQGLTDFLVEIGGEVVARGERAGGGPWRVGIERPEPGATGVQRVVLLRDRALATSGDYRNYFEIDGIRYAHAIEPSTGRPVRHPPAAVSVMAPDCMTADAWATALMVLGRERGVPLARAHGLEVLVTEMRDGDLHSYATPGFEAAYAP